MDTKKKALIVSGLLIAVGGYYIYKNMTKKTSRAEEIIAEDTLTFDTNIDMKGDMLIQDGSYQIILR
jgi:hypothetical protein